VVLKASNCLVRKSENEAKGIMFQFAYEKAWGFGFDDPFPGLRFCSLGCARVSLHLD
jgi:hypothetical protein